MSGKTWSYGPWLLFSGSVTDLNNCLSFHVLIVCYPFKAVWKIKETRLHKESCWSQLNIQFRQRRKWDYNPRGQTLLTRVARPCLYWLQRRSSKAAHVFSLSRSGNRPGRATARAPNKPVASLHCSFFWDDRFAQSPVAVTACLQSQTHPTEAPLPGTGSGNGRETPSVMKIMYLKLGRSFAGQRITFSFIS